MQIWSTLLQRSSSQSSLVPEGEQGQVGEARRTRVAASKTCSLEMYFPEALDLP